MISNAQLLLLVIFLASLISYSWAMRKVFSKPSGDNQGMKVIRASSAISAAFNVGAIVLTPAIPAARALSAVLVYLFALALFFWAVRVNRQSSLSAAFSPDSPRHLVTRGPYRWVRHPFYCAYLMTWTAGFVATGRWWLLPSIALMFIVYLKAAQVEEQKFARSPLAAEYRKYKDSTGQFLPIAGGWVQSRKAAEAPINEWQGAAGGTADAGRDQSRIA
jgi:protein-S-isoprenylcysteine O-methyltransferase Ste14